MVKKEQEPFVVTGKSYTAVAINTAAKAGEWIKSKMGDISQLQIKRSAQDLVTEVDRGSETMIRNLIKTHFPTHTILGEEEVGIETDAYNNALENVSDAEYLWIVDPIDGTTNFVHGFPFYAVSIAMAYQGEVILGVIYDPIRDELFVAEKGKGAYVKGKKIQVSAEQKLSESLLGSGFAPDHEGSLKRNLEQVGALSAKVRSIRTTGSAALHLAYVAAGRLSGYWEMGIHTWDAAAGVLLVQEAGGQVTDIAGNPYELSVRNIVASNSIIHEELLHTLNHTDE